MYERIKNPTRTGGYRHNEKIIHGAGGDVERG